MHEDVVGEATALADSLASLASPSRILLLRELRTPKALREIRIPATSPRGGPGSELMTRQAVRKHLAPLVEQGVVVAREAERPYGPTTEYALNHQRLYALSEEFRDLAKLRPTAEPTSLTIPRKLEVQAPRAPGPRLVVAKGVEEGRVFPLRPPASGKKEWLIGRKRGADVALDFDPFLSTSNTLVVYDASLYYVQALPQSRNGTLLNFEPLVPDERRPLESGDLIGVGRSLLLFRV